MVVLDAGNIHFHELTSRNHCRGFGKWQKTFCATLFGSVYQILEPLRLGDSGRIFIVVLICIQGGDWWKFD